MLQAFRSNQILNAGLYIVYILLAYISVFFPPRALAKPMPGGFFWNQLAPWIGNLSDLATVSITTVLLFISGIFLTFIVQNNLIDRSTNLFPGIFYVLICIGTPIFLNAHAILWANIFVMASLAAVVPTFKKPEIAGNLFNAGFFISLSSLFYPPTLWLGFAALLGFLTIRSLRGTQSIILLSGMVVPYFLVGTYLFWYDQLPLFWETQFFSIFGLFPWSYPGNSTMAAIGVFLLVILFLVLQAGSFFLKRRMEQQKMIQIVYQFLLLAGLSFILVKDPHPAHLLIVAPTLAVLLSLFFSQISARFGGLLFSILVLGILTIHYYPIVLRLL